MNRFERILPNWLKSRVERERERNLAKKEEIVYKFDTIVSLLNHCFIFRKNNSKVFYRYIMPTDQCI